MDDEPRINILSNIPLETDDGRKSAKGLIQAVIACLVIGALWYILFGV